jgi:hypothetical protein
MPGNSGLFAPLFALSPPGEELPVHDNAFILFDMGDTKGEQDDGTEMGLGARVASP